MSNGDKMREEFKRLTSRNLSNSEIVRSDYEFGFVAAWKAATEACAAIKDAEIADITKRKDAYFLEMCEVIDKNEKLLEEIAARDLMIKELQEAALRVQESPYSGSGVEFVKAMQQLKEALAKSEHHDSRALEKMLLEARIGALEEINGLESWTVDVAIRGYKVKLTELNKEN